MSKKDLDLTLEKLYQDNPSEFTSAIQSWSAKLNTPSSSQKSSPISTRSWLYIITVSFILSLLALLPSILGWNLSDDLAQKYFSFGIPLFVFLGWLAINIYNSPTRTIYDNRILISLIPIIVFMVIFPYSKTLLLPYERQVVSDTFITTALSLPVIFFLLLAYQHLKDKFWNPLARSSFLQHFFDSIFYILTIEFGGIVLSGLALALFSAIFSYHFFTWYTTWIVPAGAISAVSFGVYLSTKYQSLQKLTSVLARIFNPLFLILLTSYIFVSLFIGKNPYSDREFLVTCNAVLAAVMILIHLSLNTKDHLSRISHYFLVGLLLTSSVINSIALGAISLRLSSYGFTPNRIVILGTNLVMFIHLLRLLLAKIEYLRGKSTEEKILIRLTDYWIVYGIWALFVAIGLPLIYQFK